MTQTFLGYRRPDGTAGVRNQLLIIPTVTLANQVAVRVARRVEGAVAMPHEHGIGQTEADLRQTFHILRGTGANPNVGAVLVLGLSDEDQIQAEALAGAIAASGKPVAHLRIQDVGGTLKAVLAGEARAQQLAAAIQPLQREPVPVAELIVGSKCGGSDATSGLACNPALGNAMDRLVAAGGTCVFSETPEIVGAEHLIAARAARPEVAADVIAAVARFEAMVHAMGIDMRGGNPSPGNIAGGLSSIEEKSLGCISKAGTAPVQGVTGYGERPPGRGLYFMDSASNDIECVSGMAAAGCQVVCFTTGRGTPTGHPVVPVVKLCANPQTSRRMADNIDIDVSPVLLGRTRLPDLGAQIWAEIQAVAGGRLVKAEVLGHREFSINRLALSL